MKLSSNTQIILQNGESILLSDIVNEYVKLTKANKVASKLDELRKRRSQECFSITDRSELWYNSLTDEQYKELKDWRQAWLDVTDTLIIPYPPKWLNNKLEGDEVI